MGEYRIYRKGEGKDTGRQETDIKLHIKTIKRRVRGHR